MGLIDSHAYSLISAHKVWAGAHQVHLLKIRNPWGLREWQGDWSDHSTKWTASLRKELQVEDKDDGIFYISFEDYTKFFYVTTICKYMDGGDLTVVEDQPKVNAHCFQHFTIPRHYETPVVITLH